MACILLAGIWVLSREAASLTEDTAQEKKVIVIDSGHGGIDPGVVGINGRKEKDINLRISKYLKKYLEQEGFFVVMTRDSDEGLYDEENDNKKMQDLQRRCEIIKDANPALAVSIHQNSYPQENVNGPQVFYHQDSEEGERLANVIQEQLNQDLEIENPRVAKGNDSYYLLKRSENVVIIVEAGFLTNKKEAGLLEQKNYQKKVSKAICRGIVAYLEGKV